MRSLRPLLALLLLLLQSLALALTYKGSDISSLLMLESQGHTYKSSSGRVTMFETLCVLGGANTIRQRVWVNPGDGVYNQAYNIKLAQRVKAAGMGVYLDLHYSDTWADTGHQTAPKGWPTNINDLSNTVYTYTKSLCNAFHSAGINPSIISIGNEISSGFMWPLGAISTANGGYYNVARLLHSAAWGIKDSSLSPKPKIMIHVANGWDWGRVSGFFGNVLKAGPLLASDFDQIGLSYYPFYDSRATLASLRSCLAKTASAYGKEIVVAETDWPNWCPNPTHAFPSDTSGFGFSVPGQTGWIKAVAAAVSGTKGGVGMFYWEPGWVTNGALGSGCPDNLLTDYNGVALDSLSAFKSI